MAAMGTRKIAKIKPARRRNSSETNPLMVPISVGLNTFIPVTSVMTAITWNFEQQAIGLPIMREGFITTSEPLQLSA